MQSRLLLWPMILCAAAAVEASDFSSLPHFGISVGVSTLGPTIQAATAVTQKSNVRFGFNDFSYSATFNKDGIAYDASLSLRSAEVVYDQYVAGPFHISPGVMIYDGNKATATVSAPGGTSFSLGDIKYFSQSGNPLGGTASIGARTVAPMVLFGFGNLLPRSRKHFAVNLDFGVVFQGSAKANLNLSGGACLAPGSGCLNAATDNTVHANVLSEQVKINNSLRPFQYYPVISLTFGYKF